jgi:hypothetical protein
MTPSILAALWLCALQYPVYITRGAAKKVSIARTITHQAPLLGKPLKKVHGGQPVLVGEIDVRRWHLADVPVDLSIHEPSSSR